MNKKQLFEKLPTIEKDSKLMLLTHTDLDGEIPAVLLRSMFKDVSVMHCANNVMDDKIRTTMLEGWADLYDAVIVCDISCTTETAELINNSPNKNKIILLDHHATAMPLNDYDWACVHSEMVDDSFRTRYYREEDLPKSHSSGTALLYDYLDFHGFTTNLKNPELAQTMVQMTSGYDTWDWNYIFNKDDAYKSFNDMFYLYGIDIFEENMLTKLNSNTKDLLSEHDKMFLNINRKKIEDTVEKASKSFKEGDITIGDRNYSMAICFSDQYQSDMFEAMKTNLPDKDLYIINHSGGISFRTDKDDVNVSDIAKQFGGGGHPKASGMSIPIESKLAFVENVLNAKIKIIEPETKDTPDITHKTHSAVYKLEKKTASATPTANIGTNTPQQVNVPDINA